MRKGRLALLAMEWDVWGPRGCSLRVPRHGDFLNPSFRKCHPSIQNFTLHWDHEASHVPADKSEKENAFLKKPTMELLWVLAPRGEFMGHSKTCLILMTSVTRTLKLQPGSHAHKNQTNAWKKLLKPSRVLDQKYLSLILSVTRYAKSDVCWSVSQSVSQLADLTDVTLVS